MIMAWAAVCASAEDCLGGVIFVGIEATGANGKGTLLDFKVPV